MAAILFRSLSNVPASGGSFPFCSCCSRALRNNSGEATMRSRAAALLAPRQAAHRLAICRLLQFRSAIAAASRSHCSRLTRATGARYLAATCAAIFPSRTRCCTDSGNVSTSDNRRATQPALRSRRRASSSIEQFCRLSISCSSQPCSSAVSGGCDRSARQSNSASASFISHTTASTVSRPSCFSAATRWCPSMIR